MMISTHCAECGRFIKTQNIKLLTQTNISGVCRNSSCNRGAIAVTLILGTLENPGKGKQTTSSAKERDAASAT